MAHGNQSDWVYCVWQDKEDDWGVCQWSASGKFEMIPALRSFVTTLHLQFTAKAELSEKLMYVFVACDFNSDLIENP